MAEDQTGAPAVGCAVITVSDTRDQSRDQSGQLVQELLRARGHQIVHYAVIRGAPLQIKGELAIQVQRPACQVILLTGGTGLAPRNQTYDTVVPLLEKRFEAFGELYHFLAYQEIGSGAMLLRAAAGTYRGRVLFCLPGSPPAVRLAMEKLIVPELGNMVGQLHRYG
jgi:molybdenum cofactor biosynthesis protein B